MTTKNKSPFRRHTWAWLLNHSLAHEVDSLRSRGFGSYQVMSYFYMGQHEKVKGQVKKETKVIAFNRGSEVDIIWYSDDMALILGLTNKA